MSQQPHEDRGVNIGSVFYSSRQMLPHIKDVFEHDCHGECDPHY